MPSIRRDIGAGVAKDAVAEMFTYSRPALTWAEQESLLNFEDINFEKAPLTPEIDCGFQVPDWI